jgi:nitrite reductase/ring-hydroxylating ferredoxin subunit
MARSPRIICHSADLQERAKGVRFSVERHGQPTPAFAVRYDGVVRAFLNRCAHVPIELDWVEGEFFDLSGLYLVCATHGATYLPDSGRCIRGPCAGRGLAPLRIAEVDGKVCLID